MPVNPSVVSQLSSQVGLGRPGGMASRGSSPVMTGTKGQSFAAMENTLLKGKKPNPKKVAAGKAGRQFFVKAAGGDQTSGVAKTPGTFSAAPTALQGLSANTRRFPKG